MGTFEPSRRRVLQGLAATAGLTVAGGRLLDGAAGALAPASRAPRWRTHLVAGPGTRPNPALPEGVDTLPQVEHIVIYMQENHSYDGYFGMLGRGDGFTKDGQGKPTNSNPDADGKPVTVFRNPSTCDWGSAGQNWNATHKEIDGGAMDGFARLDPGSMGYWDGQDLPYYYGLANSFVVCDRWFASAPCQTHPNRRYLQAATSVGLVQTSVKQILAHPDAPNGTIWDRLNAHGITWRDYAYDLPDILLFPNVYKANKDKVRSIGDFLADAKAGTLPQVSIVSPGNGPFSEEDQDIRRGEAYSALLINAILESPSWGSTVMFFTYDEHGGQYDHVAPPAAVTPDDIPPDITVPPDEPGGFDMYGLRVPSVVISPFAKKGYVSSVVHDHTSILKFIETKWNLGALTRRDANASNLLDTLDFNAKAFAEPPVLPAPALPDAKSACVPDGAPLPTATPRVTPPESTTTTTTVAGATGTTAPATPGGAVDGTLARTGRNLGPLALGGSAAVLAGIAALIGEQRIQRERLVVSTPAASTDEPAGEQPT